jgi:hypothetical protein
MIKTGKKLNLPLDERFKISYGTVNVKNPTSIYLQISTWIKPLEDNNNYENLIKKLTKEYKQSLNYLLKKSSFDDRKWIVDLDLRSSGMGKDKKSFMSIDTVLFYHEPQDPFKDETLGFIKNRLTDLLKVFTENNSIECHLKK